MDYKIEFEVSALNDLRDIAFYEAQFTLSIEKSKDHVHLLVENLISSLETFPARFRERAYGFTETLRRAIQIGKYTAFYWIDEETNIVHIERVLHSKSNFGYIHFGN